MGGTGLYFNAITKGLSKIPVIQERKALSTRSLYKKIGRDKFYKKLLSIDPNAKIKFYHSILKEFLELMKLKFTNKSLYDWVEILSLNLINIL